jgi:hypothetical protein
MPKGKPWSNEDEEKLKQLTEAGEKADSIAAKLGKTPMAVIQKARRMNIEVDETKHYQLTSSFVQLPADLPTPEEALRILAGALKAATKPGLNRIEVQRLQVLSRIARAYDFLLSNYIQYRQIETKLMELERKYAQLIQRKKNDAPARNDTVPAQPQAQ